MSDTTTETTDDGGNIEGLTGNLDSILESLGLEPETDEERAETEASGKVGTKPAAAKDVEAKGDDDTDEKAEKKDAKADVEAKDKDKPKVDDDDAEVAALKAIRTKNLARKRGDQGRPAQVAAKPADVAAAPAAKDKVADAIAKPTPGESEVAAAVRDVVAQIAKLTADEETASAKPTGTDTGADARAAALTAIQEQIAKLADKVGSSDALTAKFGELQQKLQDQADQKFVEQRIDETISKMEDAAPLLSQRRTAIAEVQKICTAFHSKTGKWPPLEFAVSKAEAVLARREKQEPARAGEKPGKPGEKQSLSRKTVSTNHATPPSARTGPDKRTPKEVEADLWKALGRDPDDP